MPDRKARMKACIDYVLDLVRVTVINNKRSHTRTLFGLLLANAIDGHTATRPQYFMLRRDVSHKGFEGFGSLSKHSVSMDRSDAPTVQLYSQTVQQYA